ncbi:polysaccharide deacetylase family protein [Streptomyces avidinii]|uniref:Peptidoglycan/xylan/chitin deacetylase (PgdA/CDA1 family) n=1 Tax=Streptomyces avidinii TaxID=1895 RepID=A0ABS4L6S9_STRAV|nr:polysaccharide deacetylase family protein [Streptomyces avidinii]MBP2037808.1 peptidoglycan/xylan/chitin deacetylase (PgdA/CDA1 family) [Streptomyces avidinii]
MGRRAALAALVCAGAAGFVPGAGASAEASARASATPGAAAARAAATAGPHPPASLLGDEIRRLPTSRKALALTFNAAWDDAGVDTVLAELRRRKLPATFFPTGEFAEAEPAAVRAVADAGHGLGNHSYSHPYFDDLSTAERADEVRAADAAVRKASGTEPLPLFRFPYSSTTPESIADVNALGYAAIEFSADTNGYLGPEGGMSVDRAVRRAVEAFAPGAIIQMHVGSHGDGVVLDAEALPLIIDAALADGYEVIDLRRFLEA